MALSLSWLSVVRQRKITAVHLKAQELFLASVAACVKTAALHPPKCYKIQWIEVGQIEDHSSLAMKS